MEIETAGTTSWLEMFLTFPERATVWDHKFEEKNKAATNTIKKRKLFLISVSLVLGAIPFFTTSSGYLCKQPNLLVGIEK